MRQRLSKFERNELLSVEEDIFAASIYKLIQICWIDS